MINMMQTERNEPFNQPFMNKEQPCLAIHFLIQPSKLWPTESPPVRRHEQGWKSAYYLQCYDAKIEQDEVLVAAYDWRGNGTVPVLIFAREDGLTRRTKAQILFTPELIGSS